MYRGYARLTAALAGPGGGGSGSSAGAGAGARDCLRPPRARLNQALARGREARHPRPRSPYPFTPRSRGPPRPRGAPFAHPASPSRFATRLSGHARGPPRAAVTSGGAHKQSANDCFYDHPRIAGVKVPARARERRRARGLAARRAGAGARRRGSAPPLVPVRKGERAGEGGREFERARVYGSMSGSLRCGFGLEYHSRTVRDKLSRLFCYNK